MIGVKNNSLMGEMFKFRNYKVSEIAHGSASLVSLYHSEFTRF